MSDREADEIAEAVRRLLWRIRVHQLGDSPIIPRTR